MPPRRAATFFANINAYLKPLRRPQNGRRQSRAAQSRHQSDLIISRRQAPYLSISPSSLNKNVAGDSYERHLRRHASNKPHILRRNRPPRRIVADRERQPIIIQRHCAQSVLKSLNSKIICVPYNRRYRDAKRVNIISSSSKYMLQQQNINDSRRHNQTRSAPGIFQASRKNDNA